jgi:hypothetical protein
LEEEEDGWDDRSLSVGAVEALSASPSPSPSGSSPPEEEFEALALAETDTLDDPLLPPFREDEELVSFS